MQVKVEDHGIGFAFSFPEHGFTEIRDGIVEFRRNFPAFILCISTDRNPGKRIKTFGTPCVRNGLHGQSRISDLGFAYVYEEVFLIKQGKHKMQLRLHIWTSVLNNPKAKILQTAEDIRLKCRRLEISDLLLLPELTAILNSIEPIGA